MIGKTISHCHIIERLGGTRVMGQVINPVKGLVVAHFADPEGNLIGLAGPS